MREMTDDPEYDEANFRVDLGHIYSISIARGMRGIASEASGLRNSKRN